MLVSLLKAVLFLAALALAVAFFGDDEAGQLEGKARVTDGDSIIVAGERIRLKGFDAPEMRQMCRAEGAEIACGRRAREHLTRLIGDETVVCTPAGRDKYRRLLAECRAGRDDLGRRMVLDGWAVAYGDYEAEEARARRAERGLWATEFERPERWRVEHGDMDIRLPFWDWLRSWF